MRYVLINPLSYPVWIPGMGGIIHEQEQIELDDFTVRHIAGQLTQSGLFIQAQP